VELFIGVKSKEILVAPQNFVACPKTKISKLLEHPVNNPIIDYLHLLSKVNILLLKKAASKVKPT